MEDRSCKTSRWRLLKAQLNHLFPEDLIPLKEEASAYLIVDVRTESEFDLGHIKGAINIDYLSEDFWDRIEALSREMSILVYCRTGRRSIRTCTLMRNGGFDKDKIYNLEGGYQQWISKHLV